MADNTTQAGTDTIATDDVATLNGGASSGVKVQRVKAGYGDDGSYRDVSDAFPFPVHSPDSTVTATLSATDISSVGPHGGAGVPLSGTPTANSFLAIPLGYGQSGLVIQVAGTFSNSSVLWFEVSPDSTNGIDGSWTTLSCRTMGTNTTVVNEYATVAGIFRGNSSGFSYARVRMTGPVSTLTVRLRAAAAEGTTVLNAPVSVNGGALASTTGTVAVGATATVGPLNISQSGNGSFIVRSQNPAAPWAGSPVVVFEQSGDNLNWSPLMVVRGDTGQIGSTFTLGTGLISGSLIFDCALEGISYIRARVTTGPTTNGMAIDITAGGMSFPQGNSILAIPTDGHKASYSASLNGTGVASAVTASDVWCIQNPANSGVTHRITRLFLQVTLATAGPTPILQLLKRSTLNTVGTAVAQTKLPHDSGDVASNAVVNLYTAAPTLGNSVAILRQMRLFGVATVMTANPNGFEWMFGTRAKAVVLRPGQQLSLFAPTAFATAPTISGDVEWTEEPV